MGPPGRSPSREAGLGLVLLLLALPLFALPFSAACGGAGSPGVEDTRRLPQDPAFYQSQGHRPGWALDPAYQLELRQKFLEKWLAPWDQEAPLQTADQVRRGFLAFLDDLGYGENRQPHDRAWLEDLLALAGLEDYPNRGWPGITLGPTDLRGLPTSRPHLDGFDHPGQGLAFDNLQQSLLSPNSPVYVAHASRGGAWLLVDTPHGTWWVEAQKVARAGPEIREAWSSGRLAAVLRDQVPFSSQGGVFTFQAGMGALFPLVQEEPQGLTVLAAVGQDGWARPRPVRLAPGLAAAWPLPLTSRGLAAQARILMGQPYGWGGSFGNRDCSALLKDLFAPFGLWLPRNSADQASQAGQVVELGSLPPAGRERLILEQGLPYLTLLRRPGHIMLYIGEYQGRALALHSLWGLKTKDWLGNEGRVVIGGSVITGLEPGRELWSLARPEGLLLNRLESMTLLVPPQRLRPLPDPAP